MGMVRSALTANVITGLPNVRDYIHQNRDKLMEERHRLVFGADSERAGDVVPMDVDLDLELDEDEDDILLDDEIA
jgi:hypothetical protein